MISFKEYINPKLLGEGGNAVSNVTKINQENVAPTMDFIYKKILPKLGLTKEDTALLGSTGKKNKGGQSGDIDLAISGSKIIESGKVKDPKHLSAYIAKVAETFSDSVNELKGIGIVSLALLIVNKDGKQDGERVQLDLMLSPNLSWSSWIYYSPAEWESQYKGAVRNSFLSAISHVAGREGDDVNWSRKLLHFSTGLHDVTFSRKGKKNNILKNGKEVSRKFLSQDPQGVIDVLLGPKFKAKNILSFEDIWKAINSKDFLWKDHLLEIKKRVIDDIDKKGYPLPPAVRK